MRLRRFWAATACATAAFAGSVVVALPASAAVGSVLTGGPGTYQSLTTFYARSGVSLTLTVEAPGGQSGAKCIAVADGGGFAAAQNKTANPAVFGGTSTTGPDAPVTVSAFWYPNSGCNNNATALNASYTLDNTAPTINGTVAPAGATPPAQNGWYRGPVQVTWSCSETTGSGLAEPCPAPSQVTGEGASQSRTASVHDRVGNAGSATSSPINIDMTAPTTTTSVPGGWTNGSVTVTLSPTDALSGVASTTYSTDGGATWHTGTTFTLTDEGQYSLKYFSTDTAGNIEPPQTATVKIDKTAPSITATQSPVKPPSNWNRTPVDVTFSCGDTGSGLAAVDGCTGDSHVTAQGKTTVTGHAKDNAGNTSSSHQDVLIDSVDPTITASVAGPEGNGGWYTGPVTVTFACTDPGSTASPQTGSGVASCAPSQTLSNNGTSQSATGNVADLAGNTASTSVTDIKIDQVAPTTTSDAPEAWVNHTVTVHLDGADQPGLSGVDHTEYSLDGEAWTTGTGVTIGAGTHTLQFRSVDGAGNKEQAKTATVRVDVTKPTISGAADRPAVEGWYKSPVTVSFSCADDAAGSGLAPNACPAPVVLGQGADQTVPGSVTDIAGNTSSTTAGPFSIDMTAPTTTASVPGDWTNGSVTVTLSPTDALSGVASTTYSTDGGSTWHNGTTFTLTGDGEYALEYFSVDKAGNTEDTQTATVKIDTTAPSITAAQSPTKPASNWNTTPVDVTFTCLDTGSGVAVVDGCSGDTHVTAQGKTTVTGHAKDKAGNTSSANQDVLIDSIAPTITPYVVGDLGDNGWYTSPVQVTFGCTDPGADDTPQTGSGITTCEGAQILTHNGVGQTVSGTATDLAGNSTPGSSPSIKIDQTAPTTTADAPTGWVGPSATVSFMATDQAGLSGVDHTEYSLDNGPWTTGDSITVGNGEHTFRFRSVDTAGNLEDAKTSTVKVDATDPTLSLNGPSTTTQSSVAVIGQASDDGSGIDSVTVNGAPVTVDTDGSFSADVPLPQCAPNTNTITAIATDRVGRTTPKAVTVTRNCAVPAVWSTQGFFAPVDLSSPTKKVVNTVKGGSTVPLKFRVIKDGVEQKDVAVVAGMRVTTVACDTGDVISAPVEQTATGGTSLRYDGTQFVQNWKTPTTLGCYQATALLSNGSTISADFKINK